MPGSKEVLVPAGAIVRGRILAAQYEFRTSEFMISMRFDTLEANGAVSPLYVRLTREVQTEKGTSNGLIIRGGEFSLPAPGPEALRNLFVFSTKNKKNVVHAGFQSKWVTVSP
jgi:hypothetical protein